MNISPENQGMADNLWPDELKILIVDDDQALLNLMRLSLEPAGFRVLRTTRPEEGLDLALREQPDLLLVDIMMPGIDGLELLRRVRRHPTLTNIPAIIVSARVSSASKLRMLKLFETDDDHIAAYLGKPFDLSTLLKTVKAALIEYKAILLEKKRVHEKPWKTTQSLYSAAIQEPEFKQVEENY